MNGRYALAFNARKEREIMKEVKGEVEPKRRIYFFGELKAADKAATNI